MTVFRSTSAHFRPNARARMPPQTKQTKLSLDEYGCQQHHGVRYKPADLLAELNKQTRVWHKDFDAVISERDGCCKLKCKACGSEVSPSNPSQSVKSHRAACQGPPRRSPRKLSSQKQADCDSPDPTPNGASGSGQGSRRISCPCM